MEETEMKIDLLNEIKEQFGIVPAVILHEWGNKLPPSAFIVYVALCIYANRNAEAWPSIRTLSEKLAMKDRTIYYAIKSLEERSLIQVIRPENQGRGKKNTYIILDKRVNNVAPFKGNKGYTKGERRDGERVNVGGAEQYHRTIEQRGKKNNETFNGEDLGFTLN